MFRNTVAQVKVRRSVE